MPNTPLHFQTISALAASIQSRQVSPVEVTQALLERIAQLDRRYKSYATVMADHALETAKVAEQEIHAGTYRGPLHGVPVAVKDLCYTKGVRTMGGTKVLADHVPPFDATVRSVGPGPRRVVQGWQRQQGCVLARWAVIRAGPSASRRRRVALSDSNPPGAASAVMGCWRWQNRSITWGR